MSPAPAHDTHADVFIAQWQGVSASELRCMGMKLNDKEQMK